LLFQALAALATGATGALLVVLAEQHLQLPPSGFAWLIGAIGVGALLVHDQATFSGMVRCGSWGQA
jgi:hypothetical protein